MSLGARANRAVSALSKLALAILTMSLVADVSLAARHVDQSGTERFGTTAGTPILTSLSPSSGQQGQQNLSVTITGKFTHWVQGTTTASFGSGITVNSLTVNSATSAKAGISISSTATAGASNVTVTTGAEVVTLSNGF